MAEQSFNQATKIADRGYIIVHGSSSRAGARGSENELVKTYSLGV